MLIKFCTFKYKLEMHEHTCMLYVGFWCVRKSREMWWHSVFSRWLTNRTNCAHFSCLTAYEYFFFLSQIHFCCLCFIRNGAYATSGFAWVHYFFCTQNLYNILPSQLLPPQYFRFNLLIVYVSLSFE